MCELCLFPIFLENDLLKVCKILGFLSVTVTEFCGRWIVYNREKIVSHTLLGRGAFPWLWKEPGKRALGTRLASRARHSPSTKTLWKTPENIS